jgi:predicted RNA-binding protein YlxR (DUF448 family)
MPRRHEPARTCVGCRQEAGKAELIRLVRSAGDGAQRDPGGRAPGRGAYLHPDPVCVENARKRHALERALRTTIVPAFWSDLAAGSASS